METIKQNTGKLVTMIYEYQKYIKLNVQFIHALEAEGADTSDLKAEISDLEAKIAELKLRAGFAY